MHKFVPATIKKAALPAIALTLSLGLFATSAFADCDETVENTAGKAIAAAASAKTAGIVPGQGKQMISLDSCEVRAGTAVAEFKLNLIGSDGLYWVSGTARVNGASVTEMKLSSMSPNLAAASAKAGVKLASN